MKRRWETVAQMVHNNPGADASGGARLLEQWHPGDGWRRPAPFAQRIGSNAVLSSVFCVDPCSVRVPKAAEPLKKAWATEHLEKDNEEVWRLFQFIIKDTT